MSESNSTEKDKQELLEAVTNELKTKPPTIALIGVSGVGKSSTINRLFKTNLAISHTIACTKEFEQIDLELHGKKASIIHDNKAELRVFDAPGLGEDIDQDPKYLDAYKKVLPLCDVILWVTTARNRAIALDQVYLKEFVSYHDRMVFGVNQVDIVYPLNWKDKMPIPSIEQEKNINEIIKDRSEKFSKIINKEPVITPYSNSKGYNLEALFLNILKACPEGRAWIFECLKSYNVYDDIPKEVGIKKGGFLSSFFSKSS